MNCAALSLILTASLLAGSDAAAQNMPPFKDATAVRELSFDEQRTWDASAQFSRQLEASGQIDADHDLTKFVQQLTDRLFPEFAGAIRARVVRSPALNAFALANGDIYVNHGLLARMENEAQLASVIGHEGTHFTHRHVVRSRDSLNTARVLASILATFGDRGVSGLLGGLGLLSYSRDLEREADAGGMLRMRAAGFDLREAAHAYQHIEREVKVLEHSQASLLSTHPAIEERIDDLRRLGGGSAGGAGTDRSTYAQRFASLREAYLEELLSRRAVAQLLLLLEVD
jgi:predicted Zn-dependent protease